MEKYSTKKQKKKTMGKHEALVKKLVESVESGGTKLHRTAEQHRGEEERS